MSEPVDKHLKISTIQFAGCKNPIPMEKFLQFLTVKTKLSRKNLGNCNGWRERYNESENLVIIGRVMRGVEYLHAIEFGEKSQSPYSNYVNPFYLFPLMTSGGKAFFTRYYSDEIKNLIKGLKENVFKAKSQIETEMALVKELEKNTEGPTMSWRGHTTTNSEDQLVRQLDALGMTDAADLIETLDNTLDTLRQENEALKERSKDLCEVARRMLCYIPRAQGSDGPKGELEAAIKQLEGEI